MHLHLSLDTSWPIFASTFIVIWVQIYHRKLHGDPCYSLKRFVYPNLSRDMWLFFAPVVNLWCLLLPRQQIVTDGKQPSIHMTTVVLIFIYKHFRQLRCSVIIYTFPLPWINFDIEGICLIRFVRITQQFVIIRFVLNIRFPTYFYWKS